MHFPVAMELSNLIEKNLFTSEIGRATATFLTDELKAKPDLATNVSLVLLERLRLCNQPKNLWFIEDMPTKDGGNFHAAGRLWQCGSLLCSGCQQLNSRQKRKRLRAVLKATKLRTGEDFKFITFTVPNQNLSLMQSHEFVDYAFSLFRKRKWFIETFRGSVKCYEFTVTKVGIHFHVHLLAVVRFISFKKIRSEWTDCVQNAAMEFIGKRLLINTSDGNLWIDVTKCRDLDGIVFELCKYITKSNSWTKLDAAEMFAYMTCERLPRTFEMLGSFRLLDASLRKAAQSVEANSEGTEPIVHKTSLNDGLCRESWRARAERLGVGYSITQLHAEFDGKRDRRLQFLKRQFPTRTILEAPNLGILAKTAMDSHRSLRELYDIIEARDGM